MNVDYGMPGLEGGANHVVGGVTVGRSFLGGVMPDTGDDSIIVATNPKRGDGVRGLVVVSRSI